MASLFSPGVAALAQTASTSPPTQVFFATAPVTTIFKFLEPAGVALDAAGNVYATALYFAGPHAGGGPETSIQTAKFSSSGVLQWSVAPASSTLNCNVAMGNAVDAAGETFVAVDECGAGPALLVKLDANGTPVKAVTVPPAPGVFPFFGAVAYDSSSGHLYAAGYYGTSGTGVAGSVFVLEYDTDLNLLNAQTLPDKSRFTSDELLAVSVDTAGFVYAGGSAFVSGFGSQFRMLKFAPHLPGPPFYDQTFAAGTPADPATSGLLGIAPDGSGNAQAVGEQEFDLPIAGEAVSDLAVRLDTAGTAQSHFSYFTPSASYEFFPAVAQDAPGNAYVVDQANVSNYSLQQVLKFDPAGNLIWRVVPFVNEGGGSGGNLIAMDKQRNLYMVSATTSNPSGLPQMAVVKYSQIAQVSISTSAGDGQVGFVSQPLAGPLTALVTGNGGSLQGGVEVDFSTTSAPPASVGVSTGVAPAAVGQSVFVSSATSDPVTGRASAALTLGNVPADYTATATCPQCGTASAVFHVCGKLGSLDASGGDADYFNQTDSPWGNTTYDATTSSMGAKGCAVSSLAMVAKYLGVNKGVDGNFVDPADLNTWLDNNNGYTPSHNVDWSLISTYTGSAVFYDSATYKSTDNQGDYTQSQLGDFIQQDLLNGLPVVVEVANPRTGHFPHFIVLTGLCSLPSTGGYLVSDPGNRGSSNWSFTSTHTGQLLGYTLEGIRRFRRSP